MSFMDAVKSVLTHYVGFSGRARRSEFWFWVLFLVLVDIVAMVLNNLLGNAVISTIISLALLLPNLAVGARRLHDVGRTGWWQLIALTLIGIIVLIIFWVGDSQPGDNKYGPNPKAAPAKGVAAA
jgi:uncharacterized membrane protein YhaH (DUF805 family)